MKEWLTFTLQLDMTEALNGSDCLLKHFKGQMLLRHVPSDTEAASVVAARRGFDL